MPTNFKPTHTYHGTTTKRIGQECMLYDDLKESVYVAVKFSDGMHLSTLRVNVKPIEKPEFEPTHMYDNILHERHGQACRKLPGCNVVCGCNFYNIIFEDGEILYNQSKERLRELETDRIKSPVASGKVPISSADRNFKPDHYHSGGIDTWAFSEANMSTDKVIGFHLINVLKYVSRHEKKNGLEDLKKAQDSLREAIRLYEKAEDNGRTVCDSEDEPNTP